MRDYNKRIFLSLFWLVLGVILIVLEIMGRIDDFWSGMGAILPIISRAIRMTPSTTQKRLIKILLL